jgi:hypothetical protein
MAVGGRGFVGRRSAVVVGVVGDCASQRSGGSVAAVSVVAEGCGTLGGTARRFA